MGETALTVQAATTIMHSLLKQLESSQMQMMITQDTARTTLVWSSGKYSDQLECLLLFWSSLEFVLFSTIKSMLNLSIHASLNWTSLCRTLEEQSEFDAQRRHVADGTTFINNALSYDMRDSPPPTPPVHGTGAAYHVTYEYRNQVRNM